MGQCILPGKKRARPQRADRRNSGANKPQNFAARGNGGMYI
jgi:hypothetical protein